MTNHKKNKVHIIGIAGAGMSALAVLFKDAGWIVSGSDENVFPPIPEYLKKNKIKFSKKYSSNNIPKDTNLIVIGKNVHLSEEENPETRAALAWQRNLPAGRQVKSLPEALAMLSKNTENWVVAGSFGKSTVTALLAWCLFKAKRDPSYFIGAVPIDLKKSSHLGRGEVFVQEGDEYPSSNWDKRSKFLNLNPSSVLIISGEHDHVNVFPTEKSYIQPYKKLVTKIPKSGLLVYAKNSKNSKEISKHAKSKIISYALEDKKADWYGQNFKFSKVTSFDLMNHGKKIISIKTPLLGKHNMENIIGAGALLLENKKITPKEFTRAIEKFSGIKRRIELLNKKGSVLIYEGFGSSYEKARAIFEALKLHYPERRIVTVFEPHAFSWRNITFLPWYKDIFKGLDEVIMLPAVSRGKKAQGQLSSEDIWVEAKKHFPIHITKGEKETLKTLKKIVKKNDVIALVSSGSLFGLTKSVPKLFNK
ncbi:hypothetical protein K8Q98_01985 [Candidatus Nomurabacteria bacterium]|nr:hypothetical protein [Candidatus Nomurabacteria bacterium]